MLVNVVSCFNFYWNKKNKQKSSLREVSFSIFSNITKRSFMVIINRVKEFNNQNDLG